MRVSGGALTRVRELAAQRFGLEFPPERDADLEHALAEAVGGSRRRSPEAYLDSLVAGSIDDPEWGRLVGLLTVGETQFWRDPACVEELERVVLPALIQARRQEGALRLRLWSAGCATGEEPYTLAILLDQLLPDRSAWDVTLLATDLNPAAVAAARRGSYGRWSLRALPPAVRERYFEPRGSNRFELSARIRRMVQFECDNLCRDPPQAVAGAPVDLLLCRNVLMYLTREVAREVVSHFRTALAKDGWLVVAPAEASSELFRPLRASSFPGGIFFRWETRPIKRHLLGAFDPVRKPAPARRSSAVSAARAEASGPDPPDLKSRARDCANRGSLEEALQLCLTAVAADRLDGEAYRLLGAIQQERGDAPAAREALRRALYLEPDAPDAHLALGNLLLQGGHRRLGLRHLQAAEELGRRGAGAL